MSANGRLTEDELTTVQFGRLSNNTAKAWNAMVTAAARDGVGLVIAGGNSESGSGAYRSYFVQGDMHVHPELYGLNRYASISIAPAGSSTHGFGNAVDIGSFPPASNPNLYGATGLTRRDWVLKNAARFGFTRTFGEADPNHFGHDGSAFASFEAAPISNAAAPTNPAQRQGSNMNRYFRRDSDGKLALFGAGVKMFGSQADYDRHRLIQEMYAERYPNAGIIVPPESTSRENFFNLTDADWNLEVAIAGGYF